MNIEVLSLFALLFVTNYPLLYYFFYKNRGNSNLWIIEVYIEKVSIVGKEY